MRSCKLVRHGLNCAAKEKSNQAAVAKGQENSLCFLFASVLMSAAAVFL